MAPIILYFLNDLFFINEDTDIDSCVYVNSPCVSNDIMDGVIKPLEEASQVLFKWFNNLMETNAKKCHFFI